MFIMRRRFNKIIRKILSKNYRYYSKSYYYDKSFAIYNNIESLCNLFSCEKQTLETKTPVFLSTNIKFGSNQNQIKKKLGSPGSYMLRSVNSLDFKIMYYRMYLGGYKTKQEVHLYENTLYYFNYVFSYLNNADKEVIKKLLCKKYLEKDYEIIDHLIIDKYGNSIFITDSVNFTINYLTGDKSIPKEFYALKKVNEINRKKTIEQNQEELLSKL